MDAEFEFHYWSQLPPELQLHILSFIEVKHLRHMTLCSRSMRTLVLSDTLWHNLYKRIFNTSVTERAAPVEDARPGMHIICPSLVQINPTDMESASWAEKFKAAVLQKKKLQAQWAAARERARMRKRRPNPPQSATADFAPLALALVDRVHPLSACYVQ